MPGMMPSRKGQMVPGGDAAELCGVVFMYMHDQYQVVVGGQGGWKKCAPTAYDDMVAVGGGGGATSIAQVMEFDAGDDTGPMQVFESTVAFVRVSTRRWCWLLSIVCSPPHHHPSGPHSGRRRRRRRDVG